MLLTAAITGAGDTIDKNENVPVTPQELADSAICAKAGATVAHIHVRDPKTGGVSHDPELYSETVRLIREADEDIIINVTAGGGGDFIQVKNTQKQVVKEPGFKRLRSVIDQ